MFSLSIILWKLSSIVLRAKRLPFFEINRALEILEFRNCFLTAIHCVKMAVISSSKCKDRLLLPLPMTVIFFLSKSMFSELFD